MVRCGMQYGCYEHRCDDGREKGKGCAVVFRLDHVVHGKSSGSMEAWRMLFQAYSPKNNARLGCDDARSVDFFHMW